MHRAKYPAPPPFAAIPLLLSLLAATGTAAADTPAPPNLAFISIDTLRVDRLGCYGNTKGLSPNIDALADNGILFEDALCEVPLTAPSMGAMLTSRYPRMNGSTRNGLRIPAEAATVAEQFQAAGYYTFCVQSNWTLKGRLSGLDRGFDRYDDDFEEKRWGVILGERGGTTVSRLALQYLEQRDPARPFFAWIHFSDPHAPYEFHPEFAPPGLTPHKKRKREATRMRYDTEVAFTDARVGEILRALPENTIVLLVSDHGESLYEHDYLGHGRRIYQDNMHIACIIRAPGLAPARIAAPARGIDIGPTLLGLAQLQVPPTMLGLDLLRDTPPPDRPRVIETYRGAVPRIPGLKQLMSDAGPMRRGVLLEGWKLILGGHRPELYYLPEDPAELKNLAPREKNRVQTMTALINTWDASTARSESESDTLSKEDLEALKSLGYIR